MSELYNDVRRSVSGARLWLTPQPVHRRLDLVAGFDMKRGDLTRSARAEKPIVVTSVLNFRWLPQGGEQS